MVRRYSKKKGPVRSKKVKYDGITFASGLEKHMYIALKKAKIKAVSSVIEVIKKYLILSIHQILWEMALSLNAKDVLTNLFPYAGSYLKLTYINTYRMLRYTNLKIKRNAKKP
jgi:hypothetical protein